MSATSSSRGILYFNTGEKCVDRMLVSIHSLRDHWDGRVALVSAGRAAPKLLQCCRNCNVELLEITGTGWRSAVIYTFVEQIRGHGLDPFAYLEWVFEKLMHDPPEDEHEELLPQAWVAAQRDPAMPEARSIPA
jgi:hypothetical protein